MDDEQEKRAKRAADARRHRAEDPARFAATKKRYRQKRRPRIEALRSRPDATKRCPACEAVKPVTEYHKNLNTLDGLYGWCKVCACAAKREDNLRKHNITTADFERLSATQGGTCAICLRAPPDNYRLNVDHDHACCPGARSCGECIRGLLCMTCNTALGKMKDSAELLQRAIDYLDRARLRRV